MQHFSQLLVVKLLFVEGTVLAFSISKSVNICSIVIHLTWKSLLFYIRNSIINGVSVLISSTFTMLIIMSLPISENGTNYLFMQFHSKLIHLFFPICRDHTHLYWRPGTRILWLVSGNSFQ
jgi:hypothetical protein